MKNNTHSLSHFVPYFRLKYGTNTMYWVSPYSLILHNNTIRIMGPTKVLTKRDRFTIIDITTRSVIITQEAAVGNEIDIVKDVTHKHKRMTKVKDIVDEILENSDSAYKRTVLP